MRNKKKTNVIKVNFKKLSKPTDKKAMRAYNKKYPSVFDRRPVDQSFIDSKNRFNRAYVKLHGGTVSGFDYTVNIEYWKKHGKLPEGTDLVKIKSKGMYDNDRARRGY